MKKLIVGYGIFMSACILGPLWWWALRGISQNVAGAWFITDGFFAIVAIIVAALKDMGTL